MELVRLQLPFGLHLDLSVEFITNLDWICRLCACFVFEADLLKQGEQRIKLKEEINERAY